MPFITEEVWQALPHEGESIMISPCRNTRGPGVRRGRNCYGNRHGRHSCIRNRRAEMGVPPSRRARLTIATAQPEIFRAGSAYISRLASASELEIVEKSPENTDGEVIIVTDAATMYLPLRELVDIEAETGTSCKRTQECGGRPCPYRGKTLLTQALRRKHRRIL